MKPFPYNPWIAEAIARFRSRHDEAELRSRYDAACEKDPSLAWSDFLSEAAFRERMEDEPVVATPLGSMPLSDHVKDVLDVSYVACLGNILQFSVEELRRMRGMDEKGLAEVLDYLGRCGLSVPEEGQTTKVLLTEHIEPKRKVRRLVAALDRRIAARRKEMDEASWLREAVLLYRQAEGKILAFKADKLMHQRFVRKFADFLEDHWYQLDGIDVDPVAVAAKNLALIEDLCGPEHPDVIEACHLCGRMSQDALDYPGAVPYYRREAELREKLYGPKGNDLAHTLYTLGICLLDTPGAEKEGLDTLLRALALFEEDPVENRKTLWHLCYAIANACYELGDKGRGDAFVDKAHGYADPE